MRLTRSVAPLFLALAWALALQRPAIAADDLKVAAASDLTKAFSEIGTAFQKNTGIHVLFTFGASGLLERQIEEGASFDVFAAANAEYVSTLEKKSLTAAGTVHVYAVGHLGMYSKKGMAAPPLDPSGVAQARYTRIAIANPKTAPYGKAAEEVLRSAGVWELIQGKLVIGENIRQTFQFAESGNADIAFVSAAQGREAADSGRFVPIDDRLHKPLSQELGVLERSINKLAATKFVAFVLGRDGQTILQKYGFTSPEAPVAGKRKGPKLRHSSESGR